MGYIFLFFLLKFFLATTPLVEASMCNVVPIAQWAGSPSQRAEDLQKPVNLVVVTHTVTGGCNTDDECERIANAIRNTKIDMGSEDIGLSFLVGGNGKIYEGAGWKVGSHSRGYNDKSISLSFIGNFRDKLPTKEALESAQNFLACCLNEHYLGSEYSLLGHRQLIPTISPGNALQRHIKSWPHWTDKVPSV